MVGWLVGWRFLFWGMDFFQMIFVLNTNDFPIDCDKWHLDFYVSNLMNTRETGYRCWMLTGCPFIQHIGTFIILHFVATHLNHRQCCNIICTLSIFSLVRNVVYGSTWKDIEGHMWVSNHLFVLNESPGRGRSMWVRALSVLLKKSGCSPPWVNSAASWSWRLWRQSSSLGGPTRGALSKKKQFNLEDVDQQRPLVRWCKLVCWMALKIKATLQLCTKTVSWWKLAVFQYFFGVINCKLNQIKLIEWFCHQPWLPSLLWQRPQGLDESYLLHKVDFLMIKSMIFQFHWLRGACWIPSRERSHIPTKRETQKCRLRGGYVSF